MLSVIGLPFSFEFRMQSSLEIVGGTSFSGLIEEKLFGHLLDRQKQILTNVLLLREWT